MSKRIKNQPIFHFYLIFYNIVDILFIKAKNMSRTVINQRFHQEDFQDLSESFAGTFNIPTRYIPLGKKILSSGGEGTVM
jgi:hypothetical protein